MLHQDIRTRVPGILGICCHITKDNVEIEYDIDLLEVYSYDTGVATNNLETIILDKKSVEVATKKFNRHLNNKVCWGTISENAILSEDMIRTYQNKIDWFRASCCQKLSENFIREFKHLVHWTSISEYQKLSENFIREFQNDVNWYYISSCQKLSEKFIKEFQNQVCWESICRNQNLSDDFIIEFSDRIPLNHMSRCQRISIEFIGKLKDKNSAKQKRTEIKNKILNSIKWLDPIILYRRSNKKIEKLITSRKFKDIYWQWQNSCMINKMTNKIWNYASCFLA